MSHHCEDKDCELAALRQQQSSVLRWALAINTAMFLVEIAAGWLAHSTALLADALDMLSDALAYAFTLWVLERGPRWRAVSALLKGIAMFAGGILVLAEAREKVLDPVLPDAGIIALTAAAALLANLLCLRLLWRHRADDIDLKAVWLCSRNDVLANVGVLLAAGGVAWSGTLWPDLALGVVIAVIVLDSALHIMRGALRQLAE
ncbi:MAG TPA: cation diffusion facilitator family transporter [Methylococcaceae bacterium]|nr:cation diffusion facilitator family transporter [Methylococcaceae bacterium]